MQTTWQTNNLTVAPNGSQIKLVLQNQNATLSTEGQSVTFVYVDSTQGWINTMDSTSNVRGSSYFYYSNRWNRLLLAEIVKFIHLQALELLQFHQLQQTVQANNDSILYMVVAGGGGWWWSWWWRWSWREVLEKINHLVYLIQQVH